MMVYLDYVAEKKREMYKKNYQIKVWKSNNTNMLISSVNQRKLKTWFSK